MLVLGLILILLAVGLFIGFLASGTQEVTFDSGVLDVTMSTLTIYLLGALTLFLLVAGLSLLRAGMRRAGQRRQQHKELSRLQAAERGRNGGAEPSTPTPAETDTGTSTETTTGRGTGSDTRADGARGTS